MRKVMPAAALVTSVLLLLGSLAAVLGVTPEPAPPAGPPYPPPIHDVVVYDHADLFTPETRAEATRIIVAIEDRVSAEVVVYSQYKPGSTTESTESDAAALIDQWGVGRLGFDDGLAIFVNMNRRSCQPFTSGNGQVQLYAGPGYAATFLSNSQRQQIFDEEMLPHLRACDFDEALLVALRHIDAHATPENQRALERARFIDAFVGIIGGPLAFILLVGAAASSWLRYGKDPVYLDSPSILMPAPPPNLTAAAGSVIWEGKSSRRALTTALLDLASRGELSFKPEKKLLRDSAGIQIHRAESTDPYVIRNRRRPLSSAEKYLLGKLQLLPGSTSDYITPSDLEGLAPTVPKFNERLEGFVAQQKWFREPPRKAVGRWVGRGVLALILGIVAIFSGFEVLPSGGLTLLGIGLGAGGLVMIFIAQAMPARTMAGAMLYAMLAAYRRTLQKTMEQARSMQEVVEQANLDWLETPDQAVVWGVALGLHSEVEEVIERSVEDAKAGITEHRPWTPAWYGSSVSYGSRGAGGPKGIAPGLFSSSGVPNFGGMMAALGSIGASSSSSSSSGSSGGFSGGSSGGGGGGAGGGF